MNVVYSYNKIQPENERNAITCMKLENYAK